MNVNTALSAVPSLPGSGPVLSTRTRTSAIAVNRIALDTFDDPVYLQVAPEDAFMVIYQLRDHPEHDFWIDGRFAPWGPSPRSSLNILNLADLPSARLVEPVDSLHFHVPRAALDEIAEDSGSPRITQLGAPDGWGTFDPVLRRLQDLIVDATQAPDAANRLLHDHLMLGLLSHFGQAYGGMQFGRGKRTGGLAPRQESRAKELLAASLNKEISLADIARQCDLSPAHFARAFKRSAGMTPHAWLQKQRIRHAQDLMRNSAMPLADIALACGFADQSHLTRHFSRETGSSPGAWRRNHKH